MLLSEQAKLAKPEAIAQVTEALLRIYLAHASGNNGAIMGESTLCHMHACQAKDALEAAGIAVPSFNKWGW